MPIYLGCINVHTYLENMILLEGNIEKDIRIIISILHNPAMYYKKTYTDKNKKTVNLIEHLPTIFT